MTASPTSVVIRPPLLIRVYAIAFFAVWVGVLVSFVVKSHRVGSVLVNLGFLIIGGVIVGSVLTQSVTAFADGTLRIRNWLLGRQLLTRDTIAGFQVGTGLPAPGVQMIVVSTRDRQLRPLRATATVTFVPPLRRLQGQCAALTAWREETNGP